MRSFWRVAFPTIVMFVVSVSTYSETLEGTIDLQVSGVKHWLSCHCSNGLLLRTEIGTLEPVCLPENKRLSCKKVKFTGAHQEHTNDPEPTSPCPKRKERIYFADSMECMPMPGVHKALQPTRIRVGCPPWRSVRAAELGRRALNDKSRDFGE